MWNSLSFLPLKSANYCWKASTVQQPMQKSQKIQLLNTRVGFQRQFWKKFFKADDVIIIGVIANFWFWPK